MKKLILLHLFIAFLGSNESLVAQNSIAHEWNEMQLNLIRKDLARPPVQARNLFHASIAMYDAWAMYESDATPYLLGKTYNATTYNLPSAPVVSTTDKQAYQAATIDYAAYRVLLHSYNHTPLISYWQQPFSGCTYTVINIGTGLTDTLPCQPFYVQGFIDSLHNFMLQKGNDTAYTSMDYTNGDPRALGNYIAKQVIDARLNDRANEQGNYQYAPYAPANAALNMGAASTVMADPNRWQPLSIPGAMDQNGNSVAPLQKFIGPGWGNVHPFAMKTTDAEMHTRNGGTFPVYHHLPAPPRLDTINPNDTMSQLFKWGHSMVSIWSSQLDAADNTLTDISPASRGNVQSYPVSWADQKNFYNYLQGGDPGTGHTMNPATNQPYNQQMVKKSDFLKVITQFWADGPTSETPPGHWYVIYNKASNNSLFQNKWEGSGNTLSKLELDVKAYLTIGGAMHDAAITSWGAKGWHDTPRPISAIRYMASKGQSSNMSLPRYDPAGLPLVPGYIELVQAGDPLAGTNGQNINEIKLYTWHSADTNTQLCLGGNCANYYNGVRWMLAKDWKTYQRPSFVTPPFAGYVSGHSTYSRAGAEVLTRVTGNPYFPGGIEEYTINPGSGLLNFEGDITQPIVLQWATYRDASDQASLSRIWGGIHPPFDDMNGRLAGEKIGNEAFDYAATFFDKSVLPTTATSFSVQFQSNCTAVLSWNVTQENTVQSYKIYKSEDGITWYNLGTITKQVTNNGSYQFLHSSPATTKYYRIDAINTNGLAFTISSTSVPPTCYLGVNESTSNSILVTKVYPNPSDGNFNFTIHSTNNQSAANIEIVDMLGRIVYDKSVLLDGIDTDLHLNLDNVLTGIYFLKITTKDGYLSTQKLEINR